MINWDRYLQDNPDVAAAGVDPAQHYAQYGQSEGRQVVDTAPAQQAAPQQVTDQQIQDWYAQHQNDQNIAEAVSQGMQTYGLDQNRVQQLTGYNFSQPQPPQGIQQLVNTPPPAAPEQVTDQQILDWYYQHQGDQNLAEQVSQGMQTYGLDPNRVKALTGWTAPYDSMGGGGLDSQPTLTRPGISKEQSDYTAAHAMSREDFLKKYGTTFVADDKGGNAASEVAGQDVANYYDTYLAPGASKVGMVSHGWDSDPTWEQITWGGGKYSDAHPYFDAYDNVNPHPESQLGNGWDEAWKSVGRPIATAAAMFYGLPYLAGTAGAGTAPGLAGILGMEAGTGATMLNAGALGTAKGVVVDKKNIGDALIGGAKSALTSGVGSVFSDAVAAAEIPGISDNMADVLGNTGAQALVNGPDAAKGYFINGMVDLGMNSIAKDIGLDKLPPSMQQAAKTTMSSVLQGKNPTDALISIAAGAAINSVFGDSVSKIPGYSSLSPAGKQAALAVAGDVLRGKSATGDLFNLAVAEAGAETRRQLKAGNTVVSKDAAPLPLDQVAALNEAGLTDTTPPTTMDYIDTVQGGAPATDLGTVNVSGSKMPWDFQVPDQVPDLPVNLGADQREIQLAPVTVTGKRDPEIQLEPVTVVGKREPTLELDPVTVVGKREPTLELDPVTVTAPREQPVFEVPDIPRVDIPPVDLGPAPIKGTAPKVTLPKPSVPVKTPSKAAPTPAPSTEAPAAGYAPSGGYPNLATSHYAGKDFRSDVMKLDKYGRLIDDPHKGLSVTQAGKELDLPSTETVADAVGTVDNTTGLTMGPLGIPTADSMAALFGLE